VLPDGPGEYQMVIEAADDPALKLSGISAKRILPSTGSISLYITNSEPQITVAAPLNGDFVTSLAASGVVDDAFGPLSVSAVIDNDTAHAQQATLTAVSSSQSSWTFSAAGLTEGQHTVAFTGLNKAAVKSSVPLTIQFKVDTTPPTVSVQSSAPAVAGSQRPNPFADVSTAAAPGSVVNTVNGVARFKGIAGDTASLKSVAWKIQHASSTSTSPWTLDTNPVDSGNFPSSSMSLWTLDVDTTDSSKYTDGQSYAITLTATDQAGNVSDPAVGGVRSFHVQQSTDLPVFTLVNMTSSAVDSASAKLNLLVNRIQLDATVADDDRIDASTLQIFIDRTVSGSPDDTILGTQAPDGSISFSYNFATTSAGQGKALSEGRHFFSLRVSDDASWKGGKPAASTTAGPV
jgi:hypothetical protein